MNVNINTNGAANSLESVTAYLRLWRIETRRSVVIWFLPVIALIGWWYASARMPYGTITWTQTSVAIGLAGTMMMPLVAGVAAWTAGRERRRGMSDLLAATPRPPIARDLVVWGAVVGWSLLGYLALAIVFVITTDVLGTWGGPTLWPMAIGALSIALGAALGCLFGVLIPSRFVPALLPIALAFVLGAPHTWGMRWPSMKLISPEAALWPYDYDVFSGLPSDRAIPFALWLGGLTAVCFSLIVIFRGLTRPAMASLVVAIAVAGVGAWLLVNPATPSRADGSMPADYDPFCTGEVVTVCGHPAYERNLKRAERALRPMFAPLLGIPGVPTRIEQDVPGSAETSTDILLMQADIDVDLVIADVVNGLMWALAGDENHQSQSDDAGAVQFAIGRWLLERAGLPADFMSPYSFASMPDQADEITASADRVQERFAALSEVEQRGWLEMYFTDLRAGRVTPDDLP